MAKKTGRRRGKRTGDSSTPSANGTEKPNKSAAVRTYLEAHPNAKAKEVIAALAANGIEISANYVSMIKSKGLAKASRRKKGVAPADVSSRGQLEAALDLARSCRWDFDSARHFLEMVEKVHQSLG